MQHVVIFGGPGGATIAAQSIAALVAAAVDIKLVGFLNDALPRGSLLSGAPVLGPFANWRDLPDDYSFLAPIHRSKMMVARAGLVRNLGIPDHRWATIIDPRAAVAADAVIGPDCFVGPFATIGPATRIGAHTVIRETARVSHNNDIGDFAFVGTNAVLCGYCATEEGAHVAPGAVVRERSRIGKYAVVGLGSVVVRNVPAFAVVAGSPARQIETIAGASGYDEE